ncbi:Oidioi.mRNA.OKI2018_I69.chr2.g4659.t1.cds [Oikopleura dioica]|uniref:Hexosyltransferase n=1 Tax=Oikopleura dioica TaxID=34765 RepID=A0ABN7SXR3_OIKDI|nr:Oidioi.mRNA.OKI2018_I69.chr2.g4659.t1.cds [Oikopleura dioica]
MERFATRRMFKSDELFKAKNYFFMLGSDSDGSAFGEDSYLREEAEKYQDIVIADFVDTYNNLPTKTQSMYDFATTYCSDSVLYFVFHDSDTIINNRELEHQIIKKVSWERLNTLSKRTITGFPFLKDNSDVKTDIQIPFLRNFSDKDGHGVVHEALGDERGQIFCLRPTGWNHNAKNTEKYNITQSEYPPLIRLPEYCNGQGAILNRKALEKIHQVSKVTEMGSFRIEDIYFTGILRAKAGVEVPERVVIFDSDKISPRDFKRFLFANHNSKDALSGTSPVIQDDRLIYAAASGFFPQVQFSQKAKEDLETELKVKEILKQFSENNAIA